MTSPELWTHITALLRDYVQAEVQNLRDALIPQLAASNTAVDARLLDAVEPSAGNPLSDLIRDVVTGLHVDSPVTVHGWRRDPSIDPQANPTQLGLALALIDPQVPQRFAVIALTPGSPPAPGRATIDAVVSTGSGPNLHFESPAGVPPPWNTTIDVACPQKWEGSLGPGGVAAPSPLPTATITAKYTKPVQLGVAGGPGLGMAGFTISLKSSEGATTQVRVEFTDVRADLLPHQLAALIGVSPTQNSADGSDGTPVTVSITADSRSGIKFDGGTAHLSIPLELKVAGLTSRGSQIALTLDGSDVHLALTTSLTASLPALPLTTTIDDAGFKLPVALSPGARLGLGALPIDVIPDGLGAALNLPPISGAGKLIHKEDTYSALIAADLGVIAVNAVAQYRGAQADDPISFLLLLQAIFNPGIQLSFGFAVGAVGGLVGVNHRVDIDALRRLVSDGSTDEVLFPDDIVKDADDIIGALSNVFPTDAGRFVIAPMVQLTWGEARMVSLSGALVLDLPAPAQASILGRLEVNVPDPVVPLVHLQASVLGTFDSGVPSFEILVSLAGSWMVGLAIRGEVYLLARGGSRPEFVLSAGGFHPNYQRPVGVPALQRLHMDLRPGLGFGMAVDAYFALTANSVQFGGQLHLEAMLAKCGVEGWLGLDALFRYEPTFSFSVSISAGVAVRAFGHRLAGIALAFVLEGPARWHAHGKGSISILFWDLSLDFDIHWGSAAAVDPAVVTPDQIAAAIRASMGLATAWVAQLPATDSTGLQFSADAASRMAAGILLHPDATIRVNETAVPLEQPFTRYGRALVPPQTWTITQATLGGTPVTPNDLDAPTTQFVRGAFNTLDVDDQLSAPAYFTAVSGTNLQTPKSTLGTGHCIDDGYQTAYLQPPPSPDPRPHPPRWGGIYLEEVGWWNWRQRLEQWRRNQPEPLQVGPPQLVQLDLSQTAVNGTAHDAHTLAAEDPPPATIPAANPGPDTWQTLRNSPDTDMSHQVFQSWELSA